MTVTMNEEPANGQQWGLTFEGVKTVRVRQVPIPTIQEPTDCIVRTSLVGVCGSDLHAYHGREAGCDHGTVMGHELVGIVDAVGASVTSLKVGDRVMCPFTTNCGSCFYCKRGLTARCTTGQLFGWKSGGKGLDGGQAQYVRVPLADGTLSRIPEGVTDEEALLLGDIFSTGFFCADNGGIEADQDQVVAVIGCGPVGLMAILGARELGAKRVIAIDMVTDRLDLAKEYGAEPVHLKEQDPLAAVHAATEGRGADVVLEVVGSESAMELAYKLLRPGGTLSCVGVHNEDKLAFSPNDAYDKNITFRIGRCPARHFMEKLVPVVVSKKYDLTRIITHRMDLKEAVEAYDMFDRKLDGCIKIVLRT
ncbi:uncharacterized protein SPPG_04804 [Spizellomyces punctatus DAOM BR117]|uniref:Enoyl reductase (ER) domain-containing protein n=1 Tax=Spizellomyces punctatus (strain DAOM BR117) TaxID=645134 RepID=A0A0L0HHA0_SPIPD|nr:uncharacterized protein SPPG_04804 [Spizellomyces punctatus DAOM BR117]KND00488.1 hypothetical protein SPPG_04804 [Spizellomyces punctatus DAOM BR117]|eukprot:XP_016608527.1 hypothetical protein SPPG_04804 [Spizellomyces punctatus DAOM BR117]